MAGAVLRSRSGAAIGEAQLAPFREAFAGELIAAGDAAYETARRIWNAMIDKRPGLIARCTGVADVVAAIRFARANDILVSVRGGGHNVGGRALNNDGLVIDLSRLKGVHVDAGHRTVRAQGGATLGDVDRETHAYGLTVPFGVVSRTGIAGLTLGGGVGWLVRKYGLTCDNVLAFDVVTADARLLTASAEENADLYWALKGGGGNFGVVTSFLYKAYPVATVLGGPVFYPRAAAASVLRQYRDFMARAPEELTAYAALVSMPDGTPATAVIACHCGEPEQAERDVRPLRQLAEPILDAIQRIPMPAMQSLLDGAFPDGTHNYWKSTFVTELSDAAIATIVEHAARATSPLTGMVVELYSGAASRIAPDATAFAQRHAQYDVGIMAQWTNAAESDSHVAWARDAAKAMQPFSSGGYLPNFLLEEPDELIRAAYGVNYARLQQVKKAYDPANFFSVNLNVKPAA